MTAVSEQNPSRGNEVRFPVSFQADAGENWQKLRKMNRALLAIAGFLIFAAFSEQDSLFSTDLSVIHAIYVGCAVLAAYILHRRRTLKTMIGQESDGLLTIDARKIRDHVTFYPDTGVFDWRAITAFTYDSDADRIEFELETPFSIEIAVVDEGGEQQRSEPTYNGVASRLHYSMDTGHLRNHVHKLRRILGELGVKER